MSFVIRHTKSDKYLNIQHYGLDLFNPGINPKVYASESLAQCDLDLFESLKSKQLVTCSNTFLGLQDHGRPKWYFEREKMKLTKRQQEKLDWYEAAWETNKKKQKFTENLNVSDLVIEPYGN